MKKIIFGIDLKYTPVDGGWKKSTAVYPKWSKITTPQEIGKDQTTVLRTGEEFGLMCLDLDTTDPQHPDAKLMMEKIYKLAPTSVQETQHGYRFFYGWDKRLAKSLSKVTKNKDSKLDIKSNMGLISIDAPVPYYKWWKKAKIQAFTDEMWNILREHLTNKYLGLPLEKEDEVDVLDNLIEQYEKEPTENLGKRIKRQEKKISNYGKPITYDDSKVQNAKDYPIRRLLNEPTATAISCISPDHDDKTPSMQITGNFAYCHGCGEHFDSISIYQILNNCDFKTAINNLTN